MNNLAQHRGPDGEGYFLGTDFALGHRRLAITDLTAQASQPMSIDGYIIVFNGEIYNFRTIKNELQTHDITFVSESDTEVILQAYRHWGDQCVQKFDGMWSFIIFDPNKNILFCSRDHLGIKPFYYMLQDEKMYIASEIKQLMPFYKKRVANTEAIVDYLLFGLEDHLQETFFKDIFKLSPGHNMVYNLLSHSFGIYPYSVIQPRELPETPNFTNQVKEKLTRSVLLREKSDVPIGTMISGGLDSAVIGACLTKGNTAYAIHAKSTDSSMDESHYAEEVADHLHLDLHIITPQIEEWKSEIDDVIIVQEEPFGGLSVVMQNKLFKQAKNDGIKVLLDGQGADELFLGYRPYLFKRFQKYKITKLIKIWHNERKYILHNPLKTILYYAFTNSKYLISIHIAIKKKFIHNSIHNFIKYKKFIKKYGLGLTFGELQVNEITKYQLPALLRYADKNAMSQSIETRLPYLDQSLVQLAVSLPLDLKIKDGVTKFSLRNAFSDRLPSSIIWRKDKLGFASPTITWFNSNIEIIDAEIRNSSFLKQVLSPDIEISKFSQNIKWKLYCLSRWAQLFGIKAIYT